MPHMFNVHFSGELHRFASLDYQIILKYGRARLGVV